MKTSGGYLTTGVVETYVETDGDSGESVVLLHGGFATAIQWRQQISALAAKFRVSAPERRAHGRTRDYEGPVSFDIYAQDTIEFLELPEVGPSHLIGHSDGAIIGILVAIQRPDLVKKLVPMGVYVNRAGIHPDVVRSMESMTVDKSLKFEKGQYEKLSPDGPDHWPVVFEKIARMWREEPDIRLTQLRTIEAPTLIVQADDDVAKEDHIYEMYKEIPDCQLAVIPGASHAFILERPDLVNQIIVQFLSEPAPSTWMPIRRQRRENRSE